MAADEIHDGVIDAVAPLGQASSEDFAIELIAVQNEEAPSVIRFVNGFVGDFDIGAIGKAFANKGGEPAYFFVMVAGQENDFCALGELGGEFVKDAVAVFGPVPALMQFPTVDDIADEVKPVAFEAAQE